MIGGFEGKVAIVTGATGGIGRAAALQLARQGAKVVAAGRRADEGERTIEMIRAVGGEGLFVQTDVTIAREVKALVDRTIAAFGRLDIAINNAGAAFGQVKITNLSEADWDIELNRNLKSVFLGLKHQMAAMSELGGGAIVNMGSVAAVQGLAGMGAYCAAKAGVLGLTRAAAAEGAPNGVRVNALIVGPAETDAWAGSSDETLAAVRANNPLGRLALADEMASAAIWLCSDGAGFVTGHSMAVDGGASVLGRALRVVGH